MLDLIKMFSLEADTTIVSPGAIETNIYQIVFFKDGEEKPFGSVSISVEDCCEFIQDKELDNDTISILDRVVLIDTLRKYLLAMKTTQSSIIDVFANGRVVSAKLQLSAPTANEVIVAIFDRDNEEMIIQPENIEDAMVSFTPQQIKDEYVHLDKETIDKIQLNLKLNHLKRTDSECLLAAFCDIYQYMQESK